MVCDSKKVFLVQAAMMLYNAVLLRNPHTLLSKLAWALSKTQHVQTQPTRLLNKAVYDAGHPF